MKTQLCSLALFLAFFIFPVLSNGQGNNSDVVYLKNGSIIHGMIIEQIPNQSIKIQTRDNNVFVYKLDEIEKITKEQKSSSGLKSAEFSNGFFLGMKAGIDLSTWSNLESSSSAKKVSKLGFQGGFVAKYRINKFASCQMELLFAQKGLKIKGKTDGNLDVKVWTNVNYLEIPILGKFTYPVGPVEVFANVGPYVGIGLTANIGSNPDVGFNQSIKFKEGGLNRLDIGLLFGGGAGYKLGIGELFLDIRYGLGLSDIANVDDHTKNESDYEATRNRNFQISVGYLIRIGK